MSWQWTVQESMACLIRGADGGRRRAKRRGVWLYLEWMGRWQVIALVEAKDHSRTDLAGDEDSSGSSSTDRCILHIDAGGLEHVAAGPMHGEV
jgi:hypothetical protein